MLHLHSHRCSAAALALQAIFPSFLSPAEVGHMITISRDHLERSEVGRRDGC